MNERVCTSQAELDAAIAAQELPVLTGPGPFAFRDYAGWVVTRGTDRPYVVARESSQPHVEARGYTQLVVRGPVIVAARSTVSVNAEGKARITGTRRIQRIRRDTPAAWCDYYGLEVRRGIVTLYKALNDDFKSPHGVSYAPGATPEAKDWDGGREECGAGLHFSPHPRMARDFHMGAKRYAACPVRLKDIVVHKDAAYPEKVKASRVAAACYEVTIDGEPVA